MKHHDLKTWKTSVLDGGNRVRLTYSGSMVLMPLIDFNSMQKTVKTNASHLKEFEAQTLENTDKLKQNLSALANKQNQREKEFKAQLQQELRKRDEEHEKHVKELTEVYEQDLEDAPEALKEDWRKTHVGKNMRKGCGDRASAEMLAMAISGVKVKDIIKMPFTYNKAGSKRVFKPSRVYEALSVNQDGDHERVLQLFSNYPDVFSSMKVSSEALENWFWKKYYKWHKGGSV